jgi:hypothetical protein
MQNLAKVERKCGSRFSPGTTWERQEGDPPCLLVRPREEDADTTAELIIGVVDISPTPEVVERFLDRAQEIREDECNDEQAILELVCFGGSPDQEQRDSARRRGVRLVSFNGNEFLRRGPLPPQRHMDLSDYVRRQNERLRADSAQYDPARYVPQSYRFREARGAANLHPDLLGDLLHWMASDDLFFVTVLSDAGRGKTFLLRELARRLSEEVPDVQPLLIKLTARERVEDLAELVRLHLGDNDGRDVFFEPDVFVSTLQSGQIALLLDGLDELSEHNTFDNAYEQLQPVINAARGRAKIVVAARAQHFEAENQVMGLVHRSDNELLHRGSWTVSIEDFNEERIKAYLESVFSPPVAADWLAKLHELPWLLELAFNPRMLGLIVDGLTSQEPPRVDSPSFIEILRTARPGRTAALLDRLITMWLTAEDNRFRGTDMRPLLTGELRLEALTRLARRVWLASGTTVPAEIGHADMLAVCEELDNERSLREPGDRTFRIKELTHALASATLLVRHETTWRFIHDVLKEFLVGRYIARAITISEPEIRRGHNRALDAELDPTIRDLLATQPLSPSMCAIIVELNPSGAESWSTRAQHTYRAGDIIRANADQIRGRIR